MPARRLLAAGLLACILLTASPALAGPRPSQAVYVLGTGGPDGWGSACLDARGVDLLARTLPARPAVVAAGACHMDVPRRGNLTILVEDATGEPIPFRWEASRGEGPTLASCASGRAVGALVDMAIPTTCEHVAVYLGLGATFGRLETR